MSQKYDAVKAMRELRRRRKEEGKCVYSFCDEPLDTKTMCAAHKAFQRQKNKSN
ncbi:hypothetical protein HP548_11900 [Paenibacillus taichungensis]|uniref:HNH endonuclease n=1 Tax=Paenibacillus taichungensis TaxID=484184 RepID=A0ABX2ML87_9BACL|nr:hypothetical protein [Paenibacillus taichungensis]NUU54781.1 hypothetical protein [Paenibacillus taichungensis]